MLLAPDDNGDSTVGEPTDDLIAISVWHRIDGEIITSGLSTAQARAAGHALDHIHTMFADQDGLRRQPSPSGEWETKVIVPASPSSSTTWPSEIR